MDGYRGTQTINIPRKVLFTGKKKKNKIITNILLSINYLGVIVGFIIAYISGEVGYLFFVVVSLLNFVYIVERD